MLLIVISVVVLEVEDYCCVDIVRVFDCVVVGVVVGGVIYLFVELIDNVLCYLLLIIFVWVVVVIGSEGSVLL